MLGLLSHLRMIRSTNNAIATILVMVEKRIGNSILMPSP